MRIATKFNIDDKVWFISNPLNKCGTSGCHQSDHNTKSEVCRGEILGISIYHHSDKTETMYEIFLEGHFRENEIFKSKAQAEKAMREH